MPSEDPCLQAERLEYRLSDRMALSGIGFNLRPGELTAVVGPNGAGKSTLLRLLAGELEPDQGCVSIGGRQLHEFVLEDLARRLAVLPQASRLNFPFKVREVIALGRRPHRTGTRFDQDIVDEVIEWFDLSSLQFRDYTTLSGGEQQRVHVARVCAQLGRLQEAGFLLLDEPTAALDLAHQHMVLGRLRTLSRNRIGVLVVLHDLNLASSYGDRVLVLDQGRVASVGPPAEVMVPALLERVFGVRIRVLELDCPQGRFIVSY